MEVHTCTHTHSALCWRNIATHTTLIRKQMRRKGCISMQRSSPSTGLIFCFTSPGGVVTLCSPLQRAADHNLKYGTLWCKPDIRVEQQVVAVGSADISMGARKYLSQSCSMLLSVTCQQELIHQAVLEMLKQSWACYLGNKPCMAEERCREREKKDKGPIVGALTLLKW